MKARIQNSISSVINSSEMFSVAYLNFSHSSVGGDFPVQIRYFFFVKQEISLEIVLEHSNNTMFFPFHFLLISSQDPMTISVVAFFFNLWKYKFSKHKGHIAYLQYFLLMLSAKLVSERKLLTLSKHLTWQLIATYFYMMLWDALEKRLFRPLETVALFQRKLKKKSYIRALVLNL